MKRLHKCRVNFTTARRSNAVIDYNWIKDPDRVVKEPVRGINEYLIARLKTLH